MMRYLSVLLLLSGCYIADSFNFAVKNQGDADSGIIDVGSAGDASTPVEDTGPTNTDGGGQDAGGSDASNPPEDGGNPPADAGGGNPPVDAGGDQYTHCANCSDQERCVWSENGTPTCRIPERGPGQGEDLPRFFSMTCMMAANTDCADGGQRCRESGGECLRFDCRGPGDCPGVNLDGVHELCVKRRGACRDDNDCPDENGVSSTCHPDPMEKERLRGDLDGLCAAGRQDLLNGKVGYRGANDSCARPACNIDDHCDDFAKDMEAAIGAKLFGRCAEDFGGEGRKSCDVGDCQNGQQCAQQYLIANAECSGDVDAPGWCYVQHGTDRHFVNGQVLQRTVDRPVTRASLPPCSEGDENNRCQPGQLCDVTWNLDGQPEQRCRVCEGGGCPDLSVCMGNNGSPCMYRCADEHPGPVCFSPQQRCEDTNQNGQVERVCVDGFGGGGGPHDFVEACQDGITPEERCPGDEPMTCTNIRLENYGLAGDLCLPGTCDNNGNDCPMPLVCRNQSCAIVACSGNNNACSNGEICDRGFDDQNNRPGIGFCLSNDGDHNCHRLFGKCMQPVLNDAARQECERVNTNTYIPGFCAPQQHGP